MASASTMPKTVASLTTVASDGMLLRVSTTLRGPYFVTSWREFRAVREGRLRIRLRALDAGVGGVQPQDDRVQAEELRVYREARVQVGGDLRLLWVCAVGGNHPWLGDELIGSPVQYRLG
jgi:hypothetical protein